MLSQPTQSNGSMLEIAVERHGDTGSISLTGELGAAQTEKFELHLRRLQQERAVRNLILNMQGVRSIDPSGLAVIRSVWEGAVGAGLDAILVRASSEVQFAFEASGLDRVLPVVYECPDHPASW